MGNAIGILMFFVGIAGCLYNWLEMQKEREKRLDEVLLFLQKCVFAMENEKIRITTYFKEYRSKDKVLNETLQEVANQLAMCMYPMGIEVWKNVLGEKKREWDFTEESFQILENAGVGFFGTKKEENISFLKKSICELEIQKKKEKEKNMQERKVWVPVSVLGGIMLMIIFV